jgi:hypothetical protein
LTGLRQSWINNRQFFLRGAANTNPFFGTQLVLLSRQLAVIADSVEEVRGVMESVFISDAEQNTVKIEFPYAPGSSEQPSMLVDELLSWVGTFASDEGPALIRDGGKYGVESSFVPVAATLGNLVKGAMSPTNHGDLPQGYFTPRVQNALKELAGQLDYLIGLATPLKHTIPSQE